MMSVFEYLVRFLKMYTRQHPQGGGREALSNPFWFLLIVNVQYEYNSIRLRQLTYFGEIPKMDQIWDPSAGLFSS